MLELVSILINILALEGILLVGISIVSLVLLLKEMGENVTSGKGVRNIFLDFKKKVYLNEKYSSVYKINAVIYGMTILTALWCFTILLGILVTSNMLAVVLMLILEILVIAIQVRNRLIVSEEDIINGKWFLMKFELMVQKKDPTFTVREFLDKTGLKVRGFIGRIKNIAQGTLSKYNSK